MKTNQEELKLYKTAYSQLEYSFKNNLNVIKQLQQQNSQLQKHLQQVTAKYQAQFERTLLSHAEKHRKQVQDQQLTFGREIDLLKKQYQNFISSLNQNYEQKQQQIITSITKKHKGQIENIRATLIKQLDSKDTELRKSLTKFKSLQESISAKQTKINESNIKMLSLQSQIQHLSRQKKDSETIYSNYQQELQSLKNSSNSWQEILKNRIKQLQQQKASLQEQMAQIRFGNKQKSRKLKDQHNKKINQLQESHSIRLCEIMRETKQIKYKFQTIKQQNSELKIQNESSKKQLQNLKRQHQQDKIKHNSSQDSLLTLREKQFEIKSLLQEKKRLCSELKNKQQQKTELKEDYEKVNNQRQNAEKALERLKVELINKTKQSEELRKELQKIKYKLQIHNYQPQTLQHVKLQNNLTGNKGLARYDKKDAIKGEVDYSQCFTQDMGPIDQSFFMLQSSAAYRSPSKPLNVNSMDQSAQNKGQEYQIGKIPHLMKRIGQLQLQNNEYKSAIKGLKQQMQRTSHMIQEKLSLKDKQIRLGKDQNMMLRQKLNDRQQTLINLSEMIRNYKSEIQKYQKLIQQSNQSPILKSQNQKLIKQSDQKQTLIKQLKEQIQDLINQRQTLEEIADELRAELNFYKQEADYQNQQAQYNGTHSRQQNERYISNASQDQSNQGDYHRRQVSRNSNNDYLNNLSNNYSQNTQHNRNQSSNSNIQNKTKHYTGITNSKQKILPSKSENQNKSNLLSQIQQKSNKRQKTPQVNRKEEPKGTKRKLHQLIKQKNALEMEGGLVMGRRAPLQKRAEEQRLQHIGTKSQRQIYERLQRISRSRSKQKATKLKDYRIEKPQKQVASVKEITKPETRQNNGSLQLQVNPNNATHSQLAIKPKGALEQLRQEQVRKSQLANRIRKEMMFQRNQSQNLQNVSMTYWEQQ